MPESSRTVFWLWRVDRSCRLLIIGMIALVMVIGGGFIRRPTIYRSWMVIIASDW
jgi:hypothetical protein